MTNVRALPGAVVPTGEPNEALIAAIKDILADAESGQLQSLYATGFLSDGLRLSCILDRGASVYSVVGSIEMLKQDYITNHTERL